MGDNLNGIFANMIQGMGFIGCAPNRVYNMAPPDGGGVEATAEGTELTLHSAAAPLTALALYGKSEQETTTGAQLLDVKILTDLEASIVKYFPVEVGNGSFTLSSNTPTESSAYNLFLLSGNVNDGANSQLNGVGEGMSRTVAAENRYVTIGARKASGNTNNPLDYNIMLNSGTTALPWEPYTGGAPSPSPAYPQEIKSVGDSGTINVTLSDGGSQSQTLPVQTPNGLPGIPVSTGGNYTDANGQQWICDEMDFKREVYVQRVKKTSSITWRLHAGYTVEDSELFSAENIKDGIQESTQYNQSFCSKLIRDNSVLNKNKSGFYQSYGSFFARIKGVSELDEFNLLMADAEFLYRLETPIETSLSPSELATYAALRTYSPTTVVSNDAGAWMKVGYKATPQPMTMLARKR